MFLDCGFFQTGFIRVDDRVHRHLVFHENLYQKIQMIDITKNIVDTQIGILQREKEN